MVKFSWTSSSFSIIVKSILFIYTVSATQWLPIIIIININRFNDFALWPVVRDLFCWCFGFARTSFGNEERHAIKAINQIPINWLMLMTLGDSCAKRLRKRVRIQFRNIQRKLIHWFLGLFILTYSVTLRRIYFVICKLNSGEENLNEIVVVASQNRTPLPINCRFVFHFLNGFPSFISQIVLYL